jgi:hypothetical protein
LTLGHRPSFDECVNSSFRIPSSLAVDRHVLPSSIESSECAAFILDRLSPASNADVEIKSSNRADHEEKRRSGSQINLWKPMLAGRSDAVDGQCDEGSARPPPRQRADRTAAAAVGSEQPETFRAVINGMKERHRRRAVNIWPSQQFSET